MGEELGIKRQIVQPLRNMSMDILVNKISLSIANVYLDQEIGMNIHVDDSEIEYMEGIPNYEKLKYDDGAIIKWILNRPMLPKHINNILLALGKKIYELKDNHLLLTAIMARVLPHLNESHEYFIRLILKSAIYYGFPINQLEKLDLA